MSAVTLVHYFPKFIILLLLVVAVVVAVAYRGGFGYSTPPPPRNSEVLTKLSGIPSSVENNNTGFTDFQIEWNP
jgi:hypothetical protein